MKKRIVLINSVVFLFLAFTVCYSQSGDAFNGYRARILQRSGVEHGLRKTRGKVVFELYDFDKKNGRVKGYFGASDGLEGEAWLSGKVTDSGELDLSGTLASYRMEVRGHVDPSGSISPQSTASEGTDPQDRGTFEVAFVSAVPANMAEDDRISHITRFEFDRYMGSRRSSSRTSQTLSPEFRRVFHLSTFIGSNFSLTAVSNISGPIAIATDRCCSEQAMGENGTYTFDGETLQLDHHGRHANKYGCM